MEELRWKKLEHNVNTLSRRQDDADERINENDKDIGMLKQILEENRKTNELITEVISYAQKTYEVFEPLAKFMSRMAKVGLLFTFLWHGIKYLTVKLGFLT